MSATTPLWVLFYSAFAENSVLGIPAAIVFVMSFLLLRSVGNTLRNGDEGRPGSVMRMVRAIAWAVQFVVLILSGLASVISAGVFLGILPQTLTG